MFVFFVLFVWLLGGGGVSFLSCLWVFGFLGYGFCRVLRRVFVLFLVFTLVVHSRCVLCWF